jgi:transposase
MAGTFSASLLAAGSDRRGDIGAALVGGGELTDKAWEQVEPLLPENGRRGQQWKDYRKVINGILWKLRTGTPWRNLPPRYGPWQTCHDRFVRWRRDGT